MRLTLLAVLLSALSVQAAPPGWLGIYYDPVAPIPPLEAGLDRAGLLGAASGLRLSLVFPDSPAERAGLLPGDLIFALDGEPFTAPAEQIRQEFRARMRGRSAGDHVRFRLIRDAVDRKAKAEGAASDFWADPTAFVDSMPDGARVEATAFKEQRILEIEATLGPRPEARWPAAPTNADIYPEGRFPRAGFTGLVWALADREGVRADTEDLFRRLGASESKADPFRLRPVIYAHRDPFRMPAMLESYRAEAGRLLNSKFESGAEPALGLAAEWMNARPGYPAPLSRPPDDFDSLVRDIEQHLLRAGRSVRRAFDGLEPEERAFLMQERWNLSDAFAEDIYIHFDKDRPRYRKNQRLIELAARVDPRPLMVAATALAEMGQASWIENAARILRERFAGELDAEILFEKDGDFGKILFGGEGSHWYREDAAFILDLAGNDFYTAGAGASAGWDLPASLCIDMAGDDAYETTRKGAQGAGCLGVAGLLDLGGDDEYIGLQWAQGAGYYGVGWLEDRAGDDVYRGRGFCQGVGLFGAGILIDKAGDDRYEGDVHVQAVGLAGGVGLLLEGAGDDRYYAKGLYPTGYGDEGIFDAWSQGCATGFRTLASGGMALLYDGGGRDRMEAGNFSQGGGYYYGWGMLVAEGPEGDHYIGSRYDQGFCAHEALGSFIDAGGDDLYQTRQGVAQGLAWDECATIFVDEGGDDRYEGGAFFSQGASAHNSFCVFIDRAGHDRYLYAPGPARAGGNDYHGGTSFSLLVDEGGRDNEYPLWDAPSSGYGHRPEYGFWLDLEGPLSGAVDELPPRN